MNQIFTVRYIEVITHNLSKKARFVSQASQRVNEISFDTFQT